MQRHLLRTRLEDVFPTPFALARALFSLLNRAEKWLESRQQQPIGSSTRWLARVWLGILPVVLAAVAYGVPEIRPSAEPWQLSGDAAFYAYQVGRMGELRGRWWELGNDPRIGRPYAMKASRNPSLYEGVDLLLASTLARRVLDPIQNYRAMIVLVLAVNAWVASILVFRLTGSYPWTNLAVVLITLNSSTAARISGHLHLFKYGWFLLAAFAFSRFIDRPTVRRGVILGLTSALVIQSSFYFGY